MVEEVYLTPEERLSQLGDSILATILNKDARCKALRSTVYSQIIPKVFSDENYIIYKVMYTFRERGIVPDDEFMRMYLMRNESVILDASEHIDINAYSDLDENPATAYTIAVLKHFTRLKGKPALSDDDFDLTLEKFKLEYKNVRLEEVMKQSELILSDGMKIGRKFMQGADAAMSYAKFSMAEIDSVMDTQSGVGFIDSSEEGLNDSEQNKTVKIGDFGLLTELNEHLGGIYAPNFYSIVAPTKGGKSKFTTRMIHNIVVEHGYSVVVWAHEGGYQAWWAQLRAVHYDWLYNSKEPDITKHKRGVNQEIILYDKFPNESVRTFEDASRVDLFTNENYGKIIMIDRPFKVETFLDEIETARKACDAKAVLVDYLQLIGWDSRNMSKTQAVGQAYQKALAYAKKSNVAFISPAQMTQDFMNEMAKSKEGSSHETRTAGGESSEVIRTPDINIALYGSVDDIRAGSMKILSIPSRMCAPFPTFDIYCDLGISMFASLKG